MNQSQSQLYNLSKSNLDDLYLENESNKTKSLIKDHENEIVGFPNDTEEIKKEPVEHNNQDNQEDAYLENFQNYNKPLLLVCCNSFIFAAGLCNVFFFPEYERKTVCKRIFAEKL